jgi:putative pyruvate formate lyase activating enzyme
LESCVICPRRCGVDRLHGELGACRTGRYAKVASAGPHYGEEPPLVGRGGSGTIFFASCNLACIYCQNYDISQLDAGEEVSPQELSAVMLAIQARGCTNINLVSPSHVVAQILEALVHAREEGLHLPLVYNTGGYDSLETLRLLEGVVDIYMPDMKYSDEKTARLHSGIKDYPAVNRAAVSEMHRQVGDLVLDERGVAVRGLLVRHLVLPGGLAGTERVAAFLAEAVSADTYLNVMDQYRPEYRSRGSAELGRRITPEEYEAAVQMVRAAGLRRLDR